MMVMYMHRMNHECLQNSMTIHSVWVVLMINTKTSFMAKKQDYQYLLQNSE